MNHTSLKKGRLDVASFPGPTQLSVTCVRREPGYEARLDVASFPAPAQLSVACVRRELGYEARLHVMQSHPLCRMCFSQYQTSSAALERGTAVSSKNSSQVAGLIHITRLTIRMQYISLLLVHTSLAPRLSPSP